MFCIVSNDCAWCIFAFPCVWTKVGEHEYDAHELRAMLPVTSWDGILQLSQAKYLMYQT